MGLFPLARFLCTYRAYINPDSMVWLDRLLISCHFWYVFCRHHLSKAPATYCTSHGYSDRDHGDLASYSKALHRYFMLQDNKDISIFHIDSVAIWYIPIGIFSSTCCWLLPLSILYLLVYHHIHFDSKILLYTFVNSFLPPVSLFI